MEKDKDAYLGTPSRLNTAYKADESRYDKMKYLNAGRSGLKLPLITLGLWQNFGDEAPYSSARKMLLHAFDKGITHFDLANNYGNPPGSAEKTLGRILSEDLGKHRDELIISTKAGYDMWPGPYGEWGSKKYLVASLDQSLKRMGLEYVDIFYSHRFDPSTPLDETMAALEHAVKQGKALYVGVSSYGVKETKSAHDELAKRNIPLTLHQPSYSFFNRWIEKDGLLDLLGKIGTGCITFSALEQGLLSGKYLHGIPESSRMASPGSLLKKGVLTQDILQSIAGLSKIASRRGQTLSQMSLAWTLQQQQVASTIIGVRNIEQLDENIAATNNLSFSKEELNEIDIYAKDMGITLWPANC
jgi:L-glyceraldehyde 3-phosphate reductase